MTITIEKKHIYGLLGFVVIAIIAILFFKSCGKTGYVTTAKDMKLNAMVTADIAEQILHDYEANWQSTIQDHHAINTKGEREWCSDFNTAITWRYIYYGNLGYIRVLDSLLNIVREDMKIMEEAPSKYIETQKTFHLLYNNINTLVSLVKEPKGSLVTFAQKVNELMIDIENQNNETDLRISINKADIIGKKVAIQKILNDITENSSERKIQKKYKEENEQFLENNAKKEGVITAPNGLQYKVIKQGNGNIPEETSRVKVHYEGTLIDGTVFDSSYERGEPAKFRCNQVIPGWTWALTHMSVGSIWMVYIPKELAYGDEDVGKIKAYSTLIFKIELLGFSK